MRQWSEYDASLLAVAGILVEPEDRLQLLAQVLKPDGSRLNAVFDTRDEVMGWLQGTRQADDMVAIHTDVGMIRYLLEG